MARHVITEAAMNMTNETKWADWSNCDEAFRPVDTGRRTGVGHRIVHDPVGGECIEFPLGSGVLYSPVAYATRLNETVRAAAPDLLDVVHDVLRWIGGLPEDIRLGSIMPEKLQAVLAKAEGR